MTDEQLTIKTSGESAVQIENDKVIGQFNSQFGDHAIRMKDISGLQQQFVAPEKTGSSATPSSREKIKLDPISDFEEDMGHQSEGKGKGKESEIEEIKGLTDDQANYLKWFYKVLSASPSEEQLTQVINARTQVNVSRKLLQRVVAIAGLHSPDQLQDKMAEDPDQRVGEKRFAEAFQTKDKTRKTKSHILDLQLRIQMAEMGIPLKQNDEKNIETMKALIAKLETQLAKIGTSN